MVRLGRARARDGPRRRVSIAADGHGADDPLALELRVLQPYSAGGGGGGVAVGVRTPQWASFAIANKGPPGRELLRV
jgi:hypothetical protein